MSWNKWPERLSEILGGKVRRIIVNKATVTRWQQLMEAEDLEIYCFLLAFQTRFSGETIQAGQCRLVKCYNMVHMFTAQWRSESKCLIFWRL